jgi:hypothetical protein
MVEYSGALWRNQGQVLTPELILGLLQAATPVPPEDKTVAYTHGPMAEQSGDVLFQLEAMRDIFDELREHHQMQWEEVGDTRAELNPNYEYLLSAERAGKYLVFTARDTTTNTLLGNTACYLYHSTHTSRLEAREDTMYVRPEARKGLMAVRFFKYCEKQLVSLGAREINVSVKTTNEVYKLWERQGYTFTDRVLTKTFEPED